MLGIKNLLKSQKKDKTTLENDPVTENKSKTVLLDDEQYKNLDSKLDNILSNLDEHDKTLRIKFDILEMNTETITHLIKGLKTFEKLPGIEAKLLQRTREELSVHRNKLFEQEVLNTINDMILRNEPTFAVNITDKLIPRTIGSKQTLYKVLKKLVKENSLKKIEYGKFTKYVPTEMLRENEKEIKQK